LAMGFPSESRQRFSRMPPLSHRSFKSMLKNAFRARGWGRSQGVGRYWLPPQRLGVPALTRSGSLNLKGAPLVARMPFKRVWQCGVKVSAVLTLPGIPRLVLEANGHLKCALTGHFGGVGLALGKSAEITPTIEVRRRYRPASDAGTAAKLNRLKLPARAGRAQESEYSTRSWSTLSGRPVDWVERSEWHSPWGL
jgi:hypothetical protein